MIQFYFFRLKGVIEWKRMHYSSDLKPCSIYLCRWFVIDINSNRLAHPLPQVRHDMAAQFIPGINCKIHWISIFISHRITNEWKSEFEICMQLHLSFLYIIVIHLLLILFALTLSLPVTCIYINYSTVYNDTLVAKGLNKTVLIYRPSTPDHYIHAQWHSEDVWHPGQNTQILSQLPPMHTVIYIVNTLGPTLALPY